MNNSSSREVGSDSGAISSEGADRSNRNRFSIFWLLAGVLFLLMYMSGVWNLNYFEIDNKSYTEGRDLWGEMTGNWCHSMMHYFDAQQLSSILWKAFFLFPALICLAVWISSVVKHAEKVTGALRRMAADNRTVLAGMFLSLIIIAGLIVFVTRGKPIVDDEYVYDLQAQIYLTGNLAMPQPPSPESFEDLHVITKPVRTGKYLFGHAALLALGSALGSPYFASVLMSLASIPLLYLLGLRTGSKEQGITAALLLSVSPWFLFTSATLLSHTSSLFLFLLAAVGWVSLEKNPRTILGFGIGFLMGWTLAVRPLTALLLFIPFGYPAYRNLGNRNWRRAICGVSAGCLSVLGLVFLYNRAITGNAFQMPFTMFMPGETIGFGKIFPLVYHNPIKGLANLAVSAIRADSWFLGWPLSFLPLLGLFALNCAGDTGDGNQVPGMQWSRWDKFWVSVIIVFCLGYMLYYCPGVSDTGPVYYYELLAPLCLLSAKGMLCVHRVIAGRFNSLRNFVPVLCVISTIASFTFFIPEKAGHIKTLSELGHYPFEFAENSIQGKAIVFVGRKPHIGWLHNHPQASPYLNDRILFVYPVDAATDEKVLKAFPDRKPFRLFYNAKEQNFVVEPIRTGNP